VINVESTGARCQSDHVQFLSFVALSGSPSLVFPSLSQWVISCGRWSNALSGLPSLGQPGCSSIRVAQPWSVWMFLYQGCPALVSLDVPLSGLPSLGLPGCSSIKVAQPWSSWMFLYQGCPALVILDVPLSGFPSLVQGEWQYSRSHSYPRHWIVVSGQIHSLAALPQGLNPSRV
jgi:hypothetical protein